MVSMKEIANICGVSIATVSKALSGKKDIGDDTRELICKKAEELGYLSNASARALKTNRTYNIGILFSDEEQSGLTHEFFNVLLDSFKVEAEKSGYDVTFINKNVSGKQMSYLQHCLYRNVDGVIIACVNFNDDQVRELVNSGIPIVTIDHVFNNKPAVISDNVRGLESLVKYAYSLGHRKIAYIYGAAGAVTDNRLKGYYRAFEELGLEIRPEYLREGKYRSPELSGFLTEQLLDLEDKPTCILYSEDYSCCFARNVIRRKGYRVPDDVSVIGYDDSVLSQIMIPRLTTYHQDTQELGKKAAVKLIEFIEHPKTALPDVIIVPGWIVEGESVRTIK